MKIYRGWRSKFGTRVLVEDRGRLHYLKRHDPANHSPDGFEWGYGGSGPACLASSLAQDATGCTCGYQHLKREFVAKLDEEKWMITEDEIRAVLSVERGVDHDAVAHKVPR